MDSGYIILAALGVVVAMEIRAWLKPLDTPFRKELFVGQEWLVKTKDGYIYYGTIDGVNRNGNNKVTLVMATEDKMQWHEDIDDFQMKIARKELIQLGGE